MTVTVAQQTTVSDEAKPAMVVTMDAKRVLRW
jgi:hypothetical protein